MIVTNISPQRYKVFSKMILVTNADMKINYHHNVKGKIVQIQFVINKETYLFLSDPSHLFSMYFFSVTLSLSRSMLFEMITIRSIRHSQCVLILPSRYIK